MSVSDFQKKRALEELNIQRLAQTKQYVFSSVDLLAGKTPARTVNNRDGPAVPLDIILCPSIHGKPPRGVHKFKIRNCAHGISSMDNANTVPAAREHDEDASVASPVAPRFTKDTQRGAKRTVNVPHFHQELQKRKMVRCCLFDWRAGCLSHVVTVSIAFAP